MFVCHYSINIKFWIWNITQASACVTRIILFCCCSCILSPNKSSYSLCCYCVKIGTELSLLIFTTLDVIWTTLSLVCRWNHTIEILNNFAGKHLQQMPDIYFIIDPRIVPAHHTSFLKPDIATWRNLDSNHCLHSSSWRSCFGHWSQFLHP